MECALCLEVYKNPRALPCQHSFCENCLKQLITKNSNPNGTFKCPSCRQRVDIPKNGTTGFPISFNLNKLRDALDKSGKQHHHSTSETSSDNPTAKWGGASQGFCKKHPKNQMSLYCKDCIEAMCTACIVNHNRHAIIDQEEKACLEKKTFISESEAKIMIKLQLCQDQSVLTKEIKKVRCNADEFISQVKRRCEDICKQVHSAGKEIINHLTEECAKMETRIDMKMVENEVLSHKLKYCIKKLRNIPDAMKIIQGKQKLEQEVNELTKAKISRIEEQIQWRFVPGGIYAESIKELVGTLQTSYVNSSSGVESIYKHISTESAASARNLPQRPVLSPLPQGTYELPSTGKEIISNIVICEDGEEYIATNRGVKVYSSAGVYTHTIAGNTNVCDIAELPDGKLAISCETVKVFSKDGSYVHTIAAAQGPSGRMALLHNDALAVCYPKEKCVRVFKDCRERAKVVSVIRGFTRERSKQQPTTWQREEKEFKWLLLYLTAHGENGLIVSDSLARAVYAFTAGEQGEYTCQWMYGVEQGRRPGMLDRPHGVATDSQGRVLVADRYNHRVLLLSPAGEMLMELLTQEDGLNYPSSVAVGAGKLALINAETKIRIYNYM